MIPTSQTPPQTLAHPLDDVQSGKGSSWREECSGSGAYLLQYQAQRDARNARHGCTRLLPLIGSLFCRDDHCDTMWIAASIGIDDGRYGLNQIDRLPASITVHASSRCKKKHGLAARYRHPNLKPQIAHRSQTIANTRTMQKCISTVSTRPPCTRPYSRRAYYGPHACRRSCNAPLPAPATPLHHWAAFLTSLVQAATSVARACQVPRVVTIQRASVQLQSTARISGAAALRKHQGHSAAARMTVRAMASAAAPAVTKKVCQPHRGNRCARNMAACNA